MNSQLLLFFEQGTEMKSPFLQGKAIAAAGFGKVEYQEYMREGVGIIITIYRWAIM
jgi:hypothetical protein